jgi:hypothetical protein
MHPIESGVYKITTVGHAHELVIALENGNPRGNLVVEEPKPNELALHQQVKFSSDFYFLVAFTYTCMAVVGCSTSI